MKNTFTFLIALLITISGSGQFANGDFENWSGTPEEPDHWQTPNKLLNDLGFQAPFPVTKTTESQSGTFAARLETRHYSHPFLGEVTVPGLLTNGEIGFDVNTQVPSFGGGQPIDYRPIGLTGWYRYFPIEGDSMGAVVLLTRYNTNQNQRDTIGYGFYLEGDTVSGYHLMEMTFEYFPGIPDTIMPDTLFFIVTSTVNFHAALPGSVLYFDNIELVTGTNVREISENPAFRFYPNPSGGLFYIENQNANGEEFDIDIYNSQGRLVKQLKIEHQATPVDMTAYSSGIYFYKLRTSSGRVFQTGSMIFQ